MHSSKLANDMFELTAEDPLSAARAGVLQTGHGAIATPVFMPTATLGTLKGVNHQDFLSEQLPQILLTNTYHLYVRPGMDIMARAGGVHNFMGWPRAVLSDSGGFQVFSLAEHRQITDKGVVFRSHIDGSKHHFTPEGVVAYQRQLGSDIMIALDDCPPASASHAYVASSLARTHAWLDASVKAFAHSAPIYGHTQQLWPVIQGGTDKGLRMQAAGYVQELPFSGYAIGGLSVGEPANVMYDVVQWVCDTLPKDKPRYLMGVGKPENLLECIDRGVDMFDCVLPTRNARNGTLYTTQGVLNLGNAKWRYDFSHIDEFLQIAGYPSPPYTKAYLAHLYRSGERLADTIASMQNLSFYFYLMTEARKHIQQGEFVAWKNHIMPQITHRC